MSWCTDHGLPHSEFLSWSNEDRAKTVAYLLESNERCQMCGTAPWEWDEDRNAYEPTVKQCWGCYVREGADHDTHSLPGSRVVLAPRKQAEALLTKPNVKPVLRKES
jgi:hypothetical protein